MILIFHFQLGSRIDIGEMFWALKNSVKQAAGSAILSTVMGFVVALGLMRNSPGTRQRKLMEALLILPNFLPTLFILVFCLQWIEPFPVGTIGIILVHTVINMGLVAVLWSRRIEANLASLTTLAYLEGATRWQLLRSLKTLLLKAGLGWALFVFVVSFSSFTVPLVVGGGRGTTLEVLIYEKIRISGDMSSALTLAVLQGIFVFSISQALSFSSKKESGLLSTMKARAGRVYLLPSSAISWLTLLGLAWAVTNFLLQMVTGWQQVQAIPGLMEAIFELIPTTFGIGISVAILTAGFMVLQIYVLSHHRIHRQVAGLISLSPALVGFAMSLLFDEYQSLGVIFAITCLYYPAAFRLGVREGLVGLAAQQKVAYLMGASGLQTLLSVTLPSMVRTLSLISSMVGLWAIGDFAVSKIIFSKTFSLGMLAEALLSSYRIDAAFAVCGLLLGLGLIIIFIFQGCTYVYRQKFN